MEDVCGALPNVGFARDAATGQSVGLGRTLTWQWRRTSASQFLKAATEDDDEDEHENESGAGNRKEHKGTEENRKEQYFLPFFFCG
jgi:hypothetical protein